MSNQLHSIENLLLALADGHDPRELAEKVGLTLGMLRKRLSCPVAALNAQVAEQLKLITGEEQPAPPRNKGRTSSIFIYQHLQEVGRMVRWGPRPEALYRHLAAIALNPETKPETRARVALALLNADAAMRRHTAPALVTATRVDGASCLEEIDDPVQRRITAGLELLAEKERRENAG